MGIYNEKFMTDTFKKMAEWQAQAFDPVRKLGESSAATFEKYAKLNYEVLGDATSYSISQAHLFASATDPKAYFETQQAEASTFSDKLANRAAEYVDLVSEMQVHLQDALVCATKSVKDEVKAAAKKAAA